MPVRNYKILVELSKLGRNRISKIIKSERGTDRRANRLTDELTRSDIQ